MIQTQKHVRTYRPWQNFPCCYGDHLHPQTMNIWTDSFGSVIAHCRRHQAQTDSFLLVYINVSKTVLSAWMASSRPSLCIVGRHGIAMVLIEIAQVPFSDLRMFFALDYLQHGDLNSRDLASWAGALPLGRTPILNSLAV